MQIPLVRIVLAAAMFCGLAHAVDAPAFKSTAVKYAKLLLSDDGAKALVLAFDESLGTGTGYDLLKVVPVGFEHDIMTMPGSVNKGGQSVFVAFPVLELATFVKAAGTPPPSIGQISVVYRSNCLAGRTNEGFYANCAIQKAEGTNKWICMVGGSLKAAATQAAAPAFSLSPKAGLKVVAYQAEAPLSIKAGIIVAAGDTTMMIVKNDEPANVTMTVKDAKGAVVVKETAETERFAVTGEDTCHYSVQVPAKGTYTIQAAMDLGPVGGPVAASRSLEVK